MFPDWEAPAAETPAGNGDGAVRATPAEDRRALYLRWRPRRFEDVVGQDHVTRTLRNAVLRGRLAHAYLLTGPRGTGKTSVARILYRAANCLQPEDGDPDNVCPICVAALDGRSMDLVEIDAASNRGIDDIRDLRDKVAYRPSEGRYRVYIIDEAHELTAPAWDAFLKTLEEPPDHVIFVMATTEAHKVPATIVSRCQRFDFRRIPYEATRMQLERVAAHEGIPVEPAVLERLARIARGGLRDALSLLDQLGAFATGRVDMEVARAVLGLPPVEAVRETVEALGRRDAPDVMARLSDISEGGADLRQFAEELVTHLRALLLVRAGAEAPLAVEFPPEDLAWLRAHAPTWTVGALIGLIQELTTALARTRDAQQFQVQVELALLGAAQTAHGEMAAAQPMAAAAPPRTTVAPSRQPASRPAAPPAPVPGREPVLSELRADYAASEAEDARADGPAEWGPTRPPTPSEAAGAEPSGSRGASGGAAPARPASPEGEAGRRPGEGALLRSTDPNGTAGVTPQAGVTPHPNPLPQEREDERAVDRGDSGATPPEAVPQVNVPDGTVSLAAVRQRWPDIVERVKERKPLVGAAVSTAQAVSVEGTTIVVDFGAPFHKRTAEKKTNLPVIEQAVSFVLGGAFHVRCVVGTEDAGPSLFDDPVVNLAVRTFGGQPRYLDEQPDQAPTAF